MDIKITSGGIKCNRMVLVGEIYRGLDVLSYADHMMKAKIAMREKIASTFIGKVGDDSETTELVGVIIDVYEMCDEVTLENVIYAYVNVDMFVRGV